MKLIHLSDLHLGKRVNEISMIQDQAYILRQILRITQDCGADGVLISGDIYDKSVPSAEAVTLFDDFLNRLAQQKLAVFAISGNHDSPERLAFGNKLMEGAGIYISPVYSGEVKPITLSDAHGAVDFWLLPFIKPAHVKRFCPDAQIESYTDALRVAIGQMQIDTSRRNILLTHQFVTGADRSESEEISVGGSDNVDASVFEGFDYVALGHIHGPQNIGSNRIRYCGTPLKYSFSEEDHYKSVTLVELNKKGDLKITLHPLTPLHDLRTIRGSFQEITEKASNEGTAAEDYLRIVLTDEDDIREAMGKLRIIYPNVMELKYDNTRTKANALIDGGQNTEQKSPLALFEELFEKQNNQPMSQEQRDYVAQLIESIQEDSL